MYLCLYFHIKVLCKDIQYIIHFDFLDTFWKYYISTQHPSYRYQPFWNFLYVHLDKNCYMLDGNPSDFILGNHIVGLSANDYNSKIN
jgi:hypothetical protein